MPEDKYRKMGISLPPNSADIIERVAADYSLPKSCVVNIAITRPERFRVMAGDSAPERTTKGKKKKKTPAPGTEEKGFLDELFDTEEKAINEDHEPESDSFWDSDIL